MPNRRALLLLRFFRQVRAQSVSDAVVLWLQVWPLHQASWFPTMIPQAVAEAYRLDDKGGCEC